MLVGGWSLLSTPVQIYFEIRTNTFSDFKKNQLKKDQAGGAEASALAAAVGRRPLSLDGFSAPAPSGALLHCAGPAVVARSPVP